MERLRIDFESAVKEIKKIIARKILLQLPEGLKAGATEIIDRLRKEIPNADFFCIADPLFGACDLAEHERKAIGADLVLHFGHSQMIKSKKTVYVPVTYEISEEEIGHSVNALVKYLQRKNLKKVCGAATIQYVKYLPIIKKKLNAKGINLEFHKAGLLEAGQLLGCNLNALESCSKDSELILILADGDFHSKYAALALKKPVVQLDMFNGKIEEITKDNVLVKKRVAAILNAQKAESFGVIVCTKEGQMRLKNAARMKQLIESKGKKAYLFLADLIMPEYFLGLDVDCFVNTACPRIALEEFGKWKKPVINEEELEIALGLKKLEEYSLF